MAATATLSVQALVTGLPTGSKQLGPNSVSPTNVNGKTEDIALTNSNNVITVPTAPQAPTYVIITVPSSNTANLTLKGIAGDTGVPLIASGGGGQIVLPLNAVATFVIQASAAVTIELFWL